MPEILRGVSQLALAVTRLDPLVRIRLDAGGRCHHSECSADRVAAIRIGELGCESLATQRAGQANAQAQPLREPAAMAQR